MIEGHIEGYNDDELIAIDDVTFSPGCRVLGQSVLNLTHQCAHDLCENDGICVLGRQSFGCKCNSNFVGRTCEYELIQEEVLGK